MDFKSDLLTSFVKRIANDFDKDKDEGDDGEKDKDEDENDKKVTSSWISKPISRHFL